jgi:hypothetical protein
MNSKLQSRGTHVVESIAGEYDRLVRVARTFDEHVQDGWRRRSQGWRPRHC